MHAVHKSKFDYKILLGYSKMMFFIIPIGLALYMSSCCYGKLMCLGFDDMNEIQLHNFSSADVDSLAFEIYESNSNFSSRIDSSLVRGYGGTQADSTVTLFMTEQANRNHDYKITILSTGQVFKLTHIKTRKQKCNCPSDQYDVLDSYEVNGQPENSSEFVIRQ